VRQREGRESNGRRERAASRARSAWRRAPRFSHVRLGQVRLGMENFNLKSPISGQVRLGMEIYSLG